MISQLKPPNVKVLSLTTIASPHRGSAFADYVLDRIGRELSPSTPTIFTPPIDPQEPASSHDSTPLCALSRSRLAPSASSLAAT